MSKKTNKEAERMVKEFNKTGSIRAAKPSDLGYVGVQKSGLARQAAKALASHKKALEELK